ncbi:MAG: site-specific DNA-methyltransferase [Chloroflexota bacterium]
MPTPYYADDLVTLYHGDCRELLPLVEADVVVTDPPYGVGKADWDGEFLLPTLPDSVTTLALMPGVVNLVRCPEAIGRLAFRWALAARISNGMTRGAFGFGNWIPALYYTADGVSLYGPAQDCREFVVSGAMPDHPSPKPLGAVRWFVDRCPAGSVLDPFAGSGTTLLAAKEAGRRSIGIEIEERYCEVAANRLRQDVLGLAVPA